jgi:hypothetical protein
MIQSMSQNWTCGNSARWRSKDLVLVRPLMTLPGEGAAERFGRLRIKPNILMCLNPLRKRLDLENLSWQGRRRR